MKYNLIHNLLYLSFFFNNSPTFKEWTYSSPACDGTLSVVLSECQLHIEQGDTSEA